MDLIPITLGIAQGGKTGAAPSAAITPEMRQRIQERDGHACRCCGFRSQKYQDIHFINGAVTDIRIDNLATVCIFCHQCFYLEQVSLMRSGMLVWLPEIEQADLNHISRAIYIARISQGPVADAARRSLDLLMARRNEAKKRLGTDDPFILAMVLRDYISDQSYELRGRKLAGIRLMPLDRRIIKEADLEFNQFPQILAYWRSKDGPFGGKIPQNWPEIYKQLARAA